MSFKMKPIVLSVAATFGGVAALASLPTAAVAQQKLERVEITGSNIRRTDTETVAPVEIITREQIERTGKPTIADVLRSIPGNTGGSFNESFANSFAPGAAGVSLRGLGQKTTLVLINGRRTSGYGFAQNLQDTFVDLNSIPSSAVERVEILKDGASAIYGSDAIAGVVNVILRRDFRGVEASADVGFFEGKKDYRATVGAGYGDLGTQRFNLFGVLEFYKRDLLQLSDTKFGKTRDFRGRDGGRNFQSLTGGGTWREVAPGGALTSNFRAISECSGTVMTAAQAVDAGLLAPTSPFNIAGNTFCTYDFNGQFTAIPGTKRIGFLGRGTAEFTPTFQGYAEVGLSRVESEQKFQSPFFAGTTGLQQTPLGLRPFTYNINFDPGVSGNPFANQARYNGVLQDMGTRDNEITSDTLRGLVGAKYSFLGVDADSAVGWSRNEVESLNLNRISLSGTSAVFNVPTTPQPPVPTSASTNYNLDAPSTNSQAVRDQMRVNFPRKSTSELVFADTKVSTELGQLPGGPVGLAVGLDVREEKLKDRPDPRASSGDILGQGITATDASRTNAAGFVEFALPLTQAIEMQLAARDDYYNDFGNAFTPKFGLKIKPTNEVLLRANWGRGFRAPTLPEISPSVATFFILVIDPLTATQPNVSGIFAGNPNLRPERSRTATVGVVLAPTTDFNVSVDYYDIAWTDIVGSDSFNAIVAGDAASRAAGGPGDPRVIRDPNNPAANGQPQIVTVLNNFRNLTRTETKGVDVDLRYGLRTGFGRFTTRLNAAYVITFDEDGVGVAGSNGGSNTIPRLKGNLTLGWEQGAWLVQATGNYIHSYRQDLLPGSFFTTTAGQTGTYPTDVPSYTTVDLFARWQVTPGLQVSASVLNVTDETPPYDPGFSTTNLFDFSQYDVRGRIFRVGVKYTF